MISERLDVELTGDKEEEKTAREGRGSFGHALTSSEFVHAEVKIEDRTEAWHTGALTVEVEVPPTAAARRVRKAAMPSIVLTAPDEEDYELFPSRTNSLVSTTSAASIASCGSTQVQSTLSLPSRSPPASRSPSRSSVSSKLTVQSTNSFQPLTSQPPSSIGSILEEPILEDDVVEQCLYDYSWGEESVDCVTQFSPKSAGTKGEGSMSSVVAIPTENQNDNINLFKRSEPARAYREVHMDKRPRTMSFPEVLNQPTHKSSLAWEQLKLLTKAEGIVPVEEAPESMDDLQRNESIFGVQKVSDVILRAKKWRKKALATKEIGKDPEMTTEEVRPDARARRRAMIEIPQAIRVELLTEAHSILQKTQKMYQTALGLSHPLTSKATVKLNELQTQLEE